MAFLFGYLNGKAHWTIIWISWLFKTNICRWGREGFRSEYSASCPLTKILMCLSKRKYLKRQRVCVFLKLFEFYDTGLNPRLEKKNTHNSVFFNMPIFEILHAYFEYESNAQCVFLKCIVNLFWNSMWTYIGK